MTRHDVTFSASALGDLRAIHGHIEADASTEVADGMVGKIVRSIEALAQFPKRGAVPQELSELGEADVRQVQCPPYRIFYEVTRDAVVILIIAHGRRDLSALLAERLVRSPLV